MEKLKIGKITGTHALKGELKIKSFSDFNDQRFVVGHHLIVGNQDLIIQTVRFHKGQYLISFQGYQDINLVEKYVGLDVYGYKDDIVLEEDEYFYGDLIGCQVFWDDKDIGQVVSIFDNGAHDILSVQTPTKKISIPYFVAFIDEVDVKQKVIKVHLIKGFLDED